MLFRFMVLLEGHRGELLHDRGTIEMLREHNLHLKLELENLQHAHTQEIADLMARLDGMANTPPPCVCVRAHTHTP